MKPKRRPTAIRKPTTHARVVLTPFDSVKYLNSDKAIAAYLNDALADGSTEEIFPSRSRFNGPFKRGLHH